MNTESLKQGTDAWLNARKGMVTASAAGAILGVNPWKNEDDVLRDMVRQFHGAPKEFTGNIATRYGNDNEYLARADFELITGFSVNETGFYVKDGWIGASPDGLINDDELLEIKTPYSLRNESDILKFKKLEQQPYYYSQIQVQLYCTGRKKCYFYQWSPSGADMLEEVEYDKEWVKENIPKLKQFYELYLLELVDSERHLLPVIPQVDDLTAIALVDESISLTSVIKDATERKKEILASLVAICGEKDSMIDGHKLTNITRKGSISTSKAIKDGVDLEEYRGSSTRYWKLG